MTIVRTSLPIPGFTGARIDRSDHIRSSPEALGDAMASLSARLLRLDGIDPVPGDMGGLAWGNLLEADPEVELIFLGKVDGKSCFVAVPPPGSPVDARKGNPWRVLAMLDDEDAALYAGARSLVDWHARHRFCAQCGGSTKLTKGGWQRNCSQCGAEHFPRVDPVVIMLAEQDGAVLLGRQTAWPAGRYSALAGFIEPGESLEEAVRRELMEEAGTRATRIDYVASQPWPFPSTLMIGCMAQVPNRDVVLDTTELCDSIWVTRAEAAAALAGDHDAPFVAPPPYAIAHYLLAHWVAQGD